MRDLELANNKNTKQFKELMAINYRKSQLFKHFYKQNSLTESINNYI